jgi:crotonobetainyl-CoA:carnitine CoA-transferase CaiB-like acyl-CoA transferase
MTQVQHDVLGALKMPACPIAMSETPAADAQAPPTLGANGRQILGEYGYDATEIDRLFDAGVVTSRERLVEPAPTGGP